jgi:hypothetical protein
MKPLDKNYLRLQFWDNIHTKNGSEFQHFFENIISKAYPDFQKIKPYGNKGDGGNDGYIKSLGIYFQVYAPEEPVAMGLKAAKKLGEDFEKLKKEWSEISEIKTYNFVYNDKNQGSVQELEATSTNLQSANPQIVFKIFNSKALEKIFFSLSESDILNLGFNIDSREALNNSYKYLEKIETALDKEHVIYALKLHAEINDIINSIKDEQLRFEYELLKARCLQKFEQINDAKIIYKDLSKRYPEDPRPTLYFAEIVLFEKDFNKNLELLESVQKEHWLYPIEILVRKSTLLEDLDIHLVDEKSFPDESKIKSNYYRLYASFLEKQNDIKRADSFIEKAIHLNPDRFLNYVVKLNFEEGRLFKLLNSSNTVINDLGKLLNEIEELEKKYSDEGVLARRAKTILLSKKLNILRIQENILACEQLVVEIFELILHCYFDLNIERYLVSILWGFALSKKHLNELVKYLKQTSIPLSDQLSQLLIIQFLIHDNLFVEGKRFFQERNSSIYFDFINNIEENKFVNVLKFLENNFEFSVALSDSLHSIPVLRKIIIDSIPKEFSDTKEKLLLLYYFDENDLENAYKILKLIDLSKIGYVESRTLLGLAQKKEAWDIVVILIQNLLEHEKDKSIRLKLKLRLFQAYFNLTNFIDVIDLGRLILQEQCIQKTLDDVSIESVLAQTIQSYLKRGDEKNALHFLNDYKKFSYSPEFKFSIESEVYLKNNLPLEALSSFVTAVKIKKLLSPEEIASLFYVLIQIDNLLEDFNLESESEVRSNCFVKITNQDRFYFIGPEEELDATKIDMHHAYYSIFISKKIGDEIIFSNKYSSNKTIEKIELILPIEKYIFWQSRFHFHKLALEDRWSGAKMIEVPPSNDSIDTQYLEAFFKDEQQSRNPLFEMYCGKNIPLAMLALNEGGLPNAIGRITNENKGFVNLSSGILEEMTQQKNVVHGLLVKQEPFMLDGTSALFLSEIGYFKIIIKYIPNFYVPQSVITMLLLIAEKFRETPGSGGFMSYAQGKIRFSMSDKERHKTIRNNILESITILESNKDNILHISLANKFESYSESKMLPELSDGCIFAQQKSMPILTEDYFYLQMNEMETGKKTPTYFSSIILIRELYEQEKITFEDYLKYFGYLSSYRCRFLSFNADDIYKAVFGDKKILRINPEFIRQLNFPLTLSSEYGVSNQTALRVLIPFILRLLLDDTISVDNIGNIFLEIINSLPSDKFNKQFSNLLLEVCIHGINENNRIILSITVKQKVDRLFEIINLFNFGKDRSFLF